MKRYVETLTKIFKKARDKRQAHRECSGVLGEISHDPDFLKSCIRNHLKKRGSLNQLHYPFPSFPAELNPYFGLVINCWIPIADDSAPTQRTTTAIHSHGEMILTTATIFGAGYENWTFSPAILMDPENEIFELKRVEQSMHSLHHVLFIDSFMPHAPFFPPSLTITLALWSSSHPTHWKDHVKRFPFFKGNEKWLRAGLSKLGLQKAFDLKIINYFDFHPQGAGFKGLKTRQEYPRGTNADYLSSLFYILQQTGNEDITHDIQEHLRSSGAILNRDLIRQLLLKIKKGEIIENQLSGCHFKPPHASFTKHEIEAALRRGIYAGSHAG